jgi:hypothetical protein
MLKRILLTLTIISLAFTCVACGDNNDASTVTPTPVATASPTAEPTPEPTPAIVYISDANLKESSWTYDNLIADAKGLMEEGINKSKFDIALPSQKAGEYTAQFYLLNEKAVADYDVLGYTYSDKDNKSMLEISYKEYEGKSSNIKFIDVKLNYNLACQTSDMASKLIKRDIETLCTFTGVQAADVTADADLNDATYNDVISGAKTLNVTFNENVSAVFTAKTVDGVLFYNADIVIK